MDENGSGHAKPYTGSKRKVAHEFLRKQTSTQLSQRHEQVFTPLQA